MNELKELKELKEIEGYKDYYISIFGEVISKKHNKERILKKRINSSGYYYINLCKNGKCKSFSIHRLVGLNFIPKMKITHKILNHKDGNKLNNNVENLEWCTSAYNSQEASRLGLLNIKKGKESNLYSGKINKKLADEIRILRKQKKLSYAKIASFYNLSKTTILNICKNKIYL